MLFDVFVLLLTFGVMEFVAWAAHKYLMHGFLWHWHEDHHQGGYHPFQKNDLFFLIFAIPSMTCLIVGPIYQLSWLMAVGFGIMLYGFCYFLVHDVVIHQRFKWFKHSNNRYIKAMRWAHKMHHRHLNKYDGESFGLLVFDLKYWQKIKNDEKISQKKSN